MDKAVETALEQYQDALDASRDQRQQVEEDIRFSDPANPEQWDDAEKRSREQDPGGSRPCLVFDQCGQYVSNVAGQLDQNTPSIHTIPANDGAHAKVAEKIDGIFRYIEHASRATRHYSRALLSSARTGVGYLTVRPEYTDRALGWQEPRISSVADPLRVVFDPWSVELDGSDATFAFILSPMSEAEFKRRYGKKDPVSFGESESRPDDRKGSVIVAEQWWMEEKTERLIVMGMDDGTEKSMTEAEVMQAVQGGFRGVPIGTVNQNKRTVHWRRMSGCDVLEEPKDREGRVASYPADGIGVVPVYGYVGYESGRLKYCGIPRRAREPQRAYNFHMSEMRAYIKQAPKSPWIVPQRAVMGLEHLWDKGSVESRAWLPYRDIDETGQPIAAPSRAPLSVNLQNHIQGAEQALRDVQASLGMYQANLGAPSNETSGVAIEQRKQQGEASTSHFATHLAASLTQIGKLTMQMMPRLLDTRRQMRILGIDGTPGGVTVDPSQSRAMAESQGGVVINPNVGEYDVRVVIGASFSTQRQQAQQAYTEMMRANPQMMPAIAPLWAQSLDVPHADKLAQVLTAMAPDPVKAILSPESEQESVGELKAKLAQQQQALEQCQQALQEAIQHAKEAQGEVFQAHQEAVGDEHEEEARERELEIKAYQAETERLKVTGANEAQIQAIVQQLLADMGATNVQQEPEGMPEAQEQAQQAQPAQPAGPSPEFMALMQSHGTLAQALTQAMQAMSKPRVRIPVRDEAGNLQHVIERPVDE